MGETPQEKIEILSVSLLEQHQSLIEDLKKMASSLHIELGWHYLLDLTWIISNLGVIRGKRILDAGAGVGLLQWYLADQGAVVISVDRLSRADLHIKYRKRFHVKGLRPHDLAPPQQLLKKNLFGESSLNAKLKSQARSMAGALEFRRSSGQVIIYNHDLLNLEDIDNDSIDSVVAVSALEHNQPENLKLVVLELLRVLKPGGALLATLGAARNEDWFHEPSRGWCYTDESLRHHFMLGDVPSNYNEYAQLFADIRECRELREGLAQFYFQSGENGMPWGEWNPAYQPVGVCKLNTEVTD